MKTTPYISDILEQPAALERCLAALEQRPALKEFRTRLRDHRYRRILLTGMGSSFFAAIPLHYRLLRNGLDAHLLETSELIHTLPELIAPENLLVVISQSGQSAESLQLLELAGGRADILAVTNGETSPLALHSQAALFIHAGAENAVSCKTYLNTLAVLTALGDDLTETGPWLPDVRPAPQAIQAYLEHWREHIARFRQQMDNAHQLFLLGRGDSLAAAQTGGLIIKEAARFPAQAMSCAAYRHGPIELTSPQVQVLVFAGVSPHQALNQRLVQAIRQFGGAADLIASAPQTNPALTLPPVPAPALPLLEMLPAQLLSVALSERTGHEAGAFQFATKITQIQ